MKIDDWTSIVLPRRKPRRTVGRATVHGCPIGTVLPHGTAVQLANGNRYVVRWSWWRRLLCWVGMSRFALKSDQNGIATVTIVHHGKE